MDYQNLGKSHLHGSPAVASVQHLLPGLDPDLDPLPVRVIEPGPGDADRPDLRTTLHGVGNIEPPGCFALIELGHEDQALTYGPQGSILRHDGLDIFHLDNGVQVASPSEPHLGPRPAMNVDRLPGLDGLEVFAVSRPDGMDEEAASGLLVGIRDNDAALGLGLKGRLDNASAAVVLRLPGKADASWVY